MANKGICGHCGTRQDLDTDGNIVYHKKMILNRHGGTRVKCSGTGTKPLK